MMSVKFESNDRRTYEEDKQAYDSISRKVLWKGLELLGTPKNLRQGDALSPTLFDLALVNIVRDTNEQRNMDIIGESVIFAYTDDIVVLQGRRKKKLFKQPFWYSTNGSIIEINFDTSITITYSKMSELQTFLKVHCAYKLIYLQIKSILTVYPRKKLISQIYTIYHNNKLVKNQKIKYFKNILKYNYFIYLFEKILGICTKLILFISIENYYLNILYHWFGPHFYSNTTQDNLYKYTYCRDK
ncbi:Uncharacterized protein FWK35_00008668 [Aphis craccivora]|uniref:Reverse transcriptase domain-containing protein n=1 Tax=Aphis craccivora TaxID=307492 RepID=A0A6G0YU31_APHCR|nr:Uncharacterized protein FWK35_00008668 [Aphis craccivora]